MVGPPVDDARSRSAAQRPPAAAHTSLHTLVVGHAVAGLAVAVISVGVGIPDHIGGRPGAMQIVCGVPVGIVFGQASLLGIWGGLGTSHLSRRIVGGVVGVGYLSVLLNVIVGESDSANFLVTSIATLLTTTILLMARCVRFRICVAADGDGAPQPLQFSIRQLLGLTFAVACVVAIGKWVTPFLANIVDPLLLAVVGALFGWVGVMCAWLILRGTYVIIASVVAIATAAGIGFGFARWVYGEYYHSLELFWVSCTSAEAVLLVASLICIRYWGYRMVHVRSFVCGVPARRRGAPDELAE